VQYPKIPVMRFSETLYNFCVRVWKNKNKNNKFLANGVANKIHGFG
jgi:hypothetical protein